MIYIIGPLHLSAYKGVILDESTASDPQDLEYIRNAKAEIKQLTDRENAVKSRLEQIKENHKKRMTNNDLKKLDNLTAKAEELAASLYCKVLKSEVGSDEAERLKRIANKASDRAERRYKKSITAYRQSEWNNKER